MGGVGAPFVVLLEMGERGEYSCREGSGVLHIDLGALKFFRISAREALKLREDLIPFFLCLNIFLILGAGAEFEGGK